MIAQGWPLWAVRDGHVFAVVGWVDMGSVTGPPLGVELGAELELPAPLALVAPLTFVSDYEAARRMTR